MYSSPTLTTPSLCQSWPGRGTNSLMTTNAGGGGGGNVRVGVARGVAVLTGDGVAVTVVAQLACLGVPLSLLPFASFPHDTIPVFVIQAVSLSAAAPILSMVPYVLELPAGQLPLFMFALSTM